MIKKKPQADEFIPEEDGNSEEDRSQLASTLAVKYLISPGEDKYPEVSYLSVGVTHALVMLQAYEKHLPDAITPIIERRIWYLERKLKRLKAQGKLTPQIETQLRSQLEDDVQHLDSIDIKDLFMHKLRMSVYQHSRGKDGRFIDSLTILGDTQLQMSGQADDGSFRSPIRNQ